LPNGNTEEIISDMHIQCYDFGDNAVPIERLIESYMAETDSTLRQELWDNIAKYISDYTDCIGNFDEELQQIVDWDKLYDMFETAIKNAIKKELSCQQ
jgi:hypothetical protein